MHFSVMTLVLATFFLACSVDCVRFSRNIRSLVESQRNPINSLSLDLEDQSVVRVTKNVEVATRNFIANLAEKLPSDRLLEDPVLLQTVDRINQITTYSLPLQENPEVIFERKESDNLKEVVVLDANEDKLYQVNKQHKNIYVVLRRVPNPTNVKPVYYFLFYAYLRPSKPEDSPVIDVGGQSFALEWDTWDDSSKKLGWSTCDSTIFFSCGLDKNVLNGTTSTEVENILKSNPEARRNPAIKIKGKNGKYDSNLYYGLFGEFDELSSSSAQGRSLMYKSGRSVVSSAGKVLCTAFSIFIKPKCDNKETERRSKNPKSLIPPKKEELLDFLTSQLNPLPPAPSVNKLFSSLTNNANTNLSPTYGSFYQGYP